MKKPVEIQSVNVLDELKVGIPVSLLNLEVRDSEELIEIFQGSLTCCGSTINTGIDDDGRL